MDIILGFTKFMMYNEVYYFGIILEILYYFFLKCKKEYIMQYFLQIFFIKFYFIFLVILIGISIKKVDFHDMK